MYLKSKISKPTAIYRRQRNGRSVKFREGKTIPDS